VAPPLPEADDSGELREEDVRVLAVAFVVLAFAFPLSAQDAAVGEAVDALSKEWTAIWNGGNAADFASLHAEDADSVDYEGETHKGRAAVVGELAEAMSYYKGSSIELVRTGLHVVSPDVVVTDGTWELQGGENPDNAPTKGHYTFILAKEGEAFRISAMRVKVPPSSN
jgi:uncharacterized protein (TIGR02246 family)